MNRICKKGSAFLLLTLLFHAFSYFPLLAQQIRKQTYQKQKKIYFRGILKNGTTNRLKQIPELELIRLERGMQLIEKIKPAGSSFRFSPVNTPTAPYLIRATYKGTSYSLLIPPKEDFWYKKQVLTVYEPGAEFQDLNVTSALWVSKRENSLNIEKVFAIENGSLPPKSFAMQNIFFFLPQNAREIRASLRYHGKGVPLPLQPVPKQKSHVFIYGLRPGKAELTIRYVIPGYRLVDRLPVNSAKSDVEGTRILVWRPADATPEIKGAGFTSINIPDVGAAYQLSYPSQAQVSYDFSTGGFLIDDPLSSDFNPLFDHPVKTIVALLIILAYLLGITAFVAKRKRA